MSVPNKLFVIVVKENTNHLLPHWFIGSIVKCVPGWYSDFTFELCFGGEIQAYLSKKIANETATKIGNDRFVGITFEVIEYAKVNK